MVDLHYIRKRKARRIMAAIAGACAGLVLILMAIALLGQRAAPLTVTLTNSGAQLALSTSINDDSNAVYLVADAVPSYVEYDEQQLILDNEELELDDEHTYPRLTLNEQSTLFFKYTFYVTNKGSSSTDYDLGLTMSQHSHQASNRFGLDAVLRVRFYENRNLDEHFYTTYAKKSKNYHLDENGEVSWKERVSDREESGYAEEFINSNLILTSTVTSLKPKEIVRYTLVFWLEGSDPECSGEAPVDSALILGVEIGAHES